MARPGRRELFPINVWPPLVDAVTLVLAAFVLVIIVVLLAQRGLVHRLTERERELTKLKEDKARIERRLEALAAAGVEAELTPFIDDTASAFAAADIIVCRAGASTVTEIAAVGAASIFVPFPSAVDDHQTTNAQFLVNAGGGWLVQQRDLTPQGLSEMLLKLERSTLVDVAIKAKNMQKINATREVVTACEELAQP